MVQGPGHLCSQKPALPQRHPSGTGGQGAPGPQHWRACVGVRPPRGGWPVCRVYTGLDHSFLTVSAICLENNLGLFILNYKNKMVYFLV